MTIQQALIRALIAGGHAEPTSKSSARYKVLAKVGSGEFYFIGALGALRVGRSVVDSRSLTGSKFYDKLLGKSTAPSEVSHSIDELI